MDEDVKDALYIPSAVSLLFKLNEIAWKLTGKQNRNESLATACKKFMLEHGGRPMRLVLRGS